MPRTQSALLEVMAEGQVSVEGRTHPVNELFFVAATQNPVEFRGTYPLPEAQMDRFAMCLSLGYVDAGTEAEVLALFDGEEYVRPEHVQELAVPVLAHRMVLDPQAKFAALRGETRKLEPMKVEQAVSYGNYFRMPGKDPYTITVLIRRPGSPSPIETTFDYRNY